MKPQTEEYAYLPEYEDLAMRIAKVAGVQTVPFGLIKTGDSYAYITKRIDRDVEDDKVKKYAMEDFANYLIGLPMISIEGLTEAVAEL